MLLSSSQIQQAIGGDRIAVSNPFFKLLRNGVQHTDVIKQFAHSPQSMRLVISVLELLANEDIESTLTLAAEMRGQHQKISDLLLAWSARKTMLMMLELGSPKLGRGQCARLFLAFPLIYRDRGKPGAINGFAIDAGWFEILFEASIHLEEIANQQKAGGRVPIQVTNVFTGDGQLRICASEIEFEGSAFAAIQFAAAEKSDCTCDLCGSPGEKTGAFSAIRTRCSKHRRGLK
jgi:hypothetical protein